jgi:ParB-like chromosome segregation protein Spo0J
VNKTILKNLRGDKMRLKVEYIPISELKPYDKNAKIHTPEQIEQIKESIQEFGMNDPIGIWGKDNLIVEGHGRLIACKELNMSEVPVIRLDDLTDEQRKANYKRIKRGDKQWQKLT